MYRTAGMAAAAWLALFGAASAADPPTTTVIPIPAGASVKAVAFSRAASTLRKGDRWGEVRSTPVCYGVDYLEWDELEEVRVTEATLEAAFREGMTAAGFKVLGDASSLFANSSTNGADLEVGGLLRSAKGELCWPFATLDTKGVKGKITLDIEWQVYSKLRSEVVARVPVVAVFERREVVRDVGGAIMAGALAEAVRKLANAPAFRDVVIGGAATPTTVAADSGQATITLARGAARPASLADTAGSVVTVLSGEGHGSGFLVSSDGYVLTNQHVTAGAKYVKIRWSDDFEAIGEVIREVKGRDVALIKTESRGRAPLALQRAAPALGAEVYAIGAPLDANLQGTVTRGIVSSASRIHNGYNFIQSDVTVNPGNSGGPLVTKEGDVLGLTVIGVRPEGVPTGINLFIPAGDAMDFLGLR